MAYLSYTMLPAMQHCQPGGTSLGAALTNPIALIGPPSTDNTGPVVCHLCTTLLCNGSDLPVRQFLVARLCTTSEQ